MPAFKEYDGIKLELIKLRLRFGLNEKETLYLEEYLNCI
jgi:hypothetical protein